MTITCANGKWNKQVSCEPVDCGLPDKYHVYPAHFSFPEGTTYGKKSTFQCREPAQLLGEVRGGELLLIPAFMQTHKLICIACQTYR